MDGIVFGIAGLAGIFTSCIDCFELIQLGREFGSDYEKCLLRLDVSRLRFTRWGYSVGLGNGSTTVKDIAASENEIKIAHQLLSSIKETFEEVQKASKRYEKTAKSSTLEVFDESTALDGIFQRLHTSMRKAAVARQSKTNILSKAAWAIYHKKRFDTMVEEIKELVDSLIQLFPNAIPKQQALAASEAAVVSDVEDLRLLSEVSMQDDPILLEATNSKLSHYGHVFKSPSATGYSKMHAGDDVAYGVAAYNHIYDNARSSDNANAHFGNVYRGPSGC